MQPPKAYIMFSIVFFPVTLFSYYIGNTLPLGLISGPFLYAIKFKMPLSKFYFHLVLPFLFFFFFFLKYYHIFNLNNQFYNSFYYLLSSVSMIIYFILITVKKRNYSIAYSDLKKEFIYIIKPIYYLLFFFTFMLYLESIDVIIKLGFSIVFLIDIFITSIFLIALFYFIKNKKAAKKPITIDTTASYNLEEMLRFEKEVKLYIEQSNFFLKTNISLDLLSEHTEIPKHQLSRLFNLHMGKKFYQVISEYRIRYAKKRLVEDSNLTIESVAYECGFNSKSSFNKYFKEYTGHSPSSYRLSFLDI